MRANALASSSPRKASAGAVKTIIASRSPPMAHLGAQTIPDRCDPSRRLRTSTSILGSAEADVQRGQAEDLPATGLRADDDDARAGRWVQRLDLAAEFDVSALGGRHD